MVTVDPVAVVEIETPFGSVADGAATPTLEDGLVEVLATLRTAVARTPSGITSWFRPETRHTYRPAAGLLQESCFAAAATEDPAVILIEVKSVVE